MSFERLAPWEAMEWFDTPLFRLVSFASGNAAQLCQANPNRVVLVFGLAGSSANGFIGFDSSVTLTTGMKISVQAGPTIFTQADHGPLAQMEWWGVGGISDSIDVIEVVLRDYPKGKAARGQFERALAKAARLRNDYNHGRGSRSPQSKAGWVDRFSPWASNERGE